MQKLLKQLPRQPKKKLRSLNKAPQPILERRTTMEDTIKVYVLYTYEQNIYRPSDWDYIPYATFTTYEEAETEARSLNLDEDEYFIKDEYKYTY